MSFVWLDDAFDLIQQRTNKIVVGFYRRPFQSRSSRRWRKLGICLGSRLSRQNPRKRRGKRTEEKRGIRSRRRKNNNSKVGGGAAPSLLGNVVYSESLEVFWRGARLAGAKNFMATIFFKILCPSQSSTNQTLKKYTILADPVCNSPNKYDIPKYCRNGQKECATCGRLAAAARSVPQSAPQ